MNYDSQINCAHDGALTRAFTHKGKRLPFLITMRCGCGFMKFEDARDSEVGLALKAKQKSEQNRRSSRPSNHLNKMKSMSVKKRRK